MTSLSSVPEALLVRRRRFGGRLEFSYTPATSILATVARIKPHVAADTAAKAGAHGSFASIKSKQEIVSFPVNETVVN